MKKQNKKEEIKETKSKNKEKDVKLDKHGKPKKKKTALMKGATVFNWLSLGVMVLAMLGMLIQLIGLIFKVIILPVSWGFLWAMFGIGAAIGVVWAIFAFIMICVFGKR